MPALTEAGYTVVAPDLRGFGDSDKPLEGYDALTVGGDIRQLVSNSVMKPSALSDTMSAPRSPMPGQSHTPRRCVGWR